MYFISRGDREAVVQKELLPLVSVLKRITISRLSKPLCVDYDKKNYLFCRPCYRFRAYNVKL